MDARTLEVMDDETVTRIASIMGDSSAAARAIVERNLRRSMGEAAEIIYDRRNEMLWVGPPPNAALTPKQP